MSALSLKIWTSSFGQKKEVLKQEFFDFFQEQILYFSNVILSCVQKTYLDFLIDNENTGIIKIEDWQGFVDKYWSILSWRGNFFKENFKLLNEEESSYEKKSFTITIENAENNNIYNEIGGKIKIKSEENQTPKSQLQDYSFDCTSKIITIGKNHNNTIFLPESDELKIAAIGFSKKGLVIRDYNKSKESTLIANVDQRKFILFKNALIKIGKTFARIKEVNHGSIIQAKNLENNSETVRFKKKKSEYVNIFSDHEDLSKNKTDNYFLTLSIEKNDFYLTCKENKSFIIGRSQSEDVDIQIKNMDVSKVHCLIGFEKGKGWWISDVKIKNFLLLFFIHRRNINICFLLLYLNIAFIKSFISLKNLIF